MLSNTFIGLISNYSSDSDLINALWLDIEKKYSANNRHYHNLTHLQNLISELELVKSKIESWNTILFSVFYHDIIYNPVKSDNEENSALFASKTLKTLSVSEEIIESCLEQILATKSHKTSLNQDTNFFTDANISILGKEWGVYELYAKNVRKEYSIFPDLIYKPGRKKVLNHFLEMERIFKTDQFFQRYENQAKSNLKKELDKLASS